MNIKEISLIVYDFDGVLTDNRVLVMEDGKEGAFCHRGDGMAMGMLKQKGIRQLILSTEKNPIVTSRAKKLDLEVIQGAEDKASALQAFCQKQGIDLNGVVYIGNDTNDLDAIQLCGHSLCPSDAAEEILKTVSAVIPCRGGHGVVRKFYDMINNE